MRDLGKSNRFLASTQDSHENGIWQAMEDRRYPGAVCQSMSRVSAVPTATAAATGKLRGAGERSTVARRSTSFVPGVSTAGAEGCHGEAMGVAMGVKVGEAMVWSVEAIGASRAVDRSVLTCGVPRCTVRLYVRHARGW